MGMEAGLKDMDDDIATVARLISELRLVGPRLLAAADQRRPGEKAFQMRLANALAHLSLLGRTQHGVFVQLLARAQEHRAVPGGAPAWLATTQGLSNGHARTLANDAKHLATHPEIAGHLTEGSLSPDATRVLARTVKALVDADTDTQRAAVGEVVAEIHTKGVTQAAKLIPLLEKKVKPRGAEEILAMQRARSYARVTELDDGAHRYHMLLDAERSTHVNAALETYAAHAYRRRQCGDVEALPAHVHTTEQVAAHAFTRLAVTFLSSTRLRGEAASESTVVGIGLDAADRRTDAAPVAPDTAYVVPGIDAHRADDTPLGTDEQPASLRERPGGSRGLRRLTGRLQRPAFTSTGHPCRVPDCNGSTAWHLHPQYTRWLRSGGLAELKSLIHYCPDHAAIH